MRKLHTQKSKEERFKREKLYKSKKKGRENKMLRFSPQIQFSYIGAFLPVVPSWTLHTIRVIMFILMMMMA